MMPQNHQEDGHSKDRPPPLALLQQQQQQEKLQEGHQQQQQQQEQLQEGHQPQQQHHHQQQQQQQQQEQQAQEEHQQQQQKVQLQEEHQQQQQQQHHQQQQQQKQQEQQQRHQHSVTESTQSQIARKPDALISKSDNNFSTYLVPDFFINVFEVIQNSEIPGHSNNFGRNISCKMTDDEQVDILDIADSFTDCGNIIDVHAKMTLLSEYGIFQTWMYKQENLGNISDYSKYVGDFDRYTSVDDSKMVSDAARGCLLPVYNVQQQKQVILFENNHAFDFDEVCHLRMNKSLSFQEHESLVSHLQVKLKGSDFGLPGEKMTCDEGQTLHPRRSCLVISNVKSNFMCTSSDVEQSWGLNHCAKFEPESETTELDGSNCQLGPEQIKNLSFIGKLGLNHHKSSVSRSKSYKNDGIDKDNLMCCAEDAKYYELLPTSLMIPSVVLIFMRRLSELLSYATLPKLATFLPMEFRKISLILHLNETSMNLSNNSDENHLFNAISKLNTDVDCDDYDQEQTYKQIKSSPSKQTSSINKESCSSTQDSTMMSTQTYSGDVNHNGQASSSNYHLSQQGLGHSWFSYDRWINFDSSCLGLGMDGYKTSSKRRRRGANKKSFPGFLYFLLFVACFMDTASAQLESGGWLLSNLLSLPNECTMEGALAPCTFLLTCLIKGGSPVNKCGGGYIYTCCVPTRMSARGAMSVRSDHRPAMPTLRHIGSLFRDAPSPSHAIPQSNLILPHRLPQRETLSPSRLPWRQKGTWFSDERLDRNYDHNTDGSHSNSLLPLGHNVVSSEDALSSFALGPSSQDLGYALNYKPPVTTNEIYYNEPECGVQKLSTTHISKRIIGGNEARFAELPWQAHIRIAGYQCGGVLVNRYYVATAAHCVHKARLRDITIHLGEFDTKDTGRHYEPYPKESFGVVEKRTHPNFKYMLTQPDRFDVAVLRLSRPAQYRPNIVPICLPPPGDHFSGMTGIVAGWGKTDNSYGKTGTNILRKVSVPIIDNQECLRWHHRKNIDVKLHYEMFCAGHSQGKMDACLGDSGGPLVVNNKGRWTLAGITSAGFGCAVDHQPGIYHKVAITSGWIAANVRP